MKITGIEIGEYRQFKNIKFDFTYPQGHPKAGQPLDKVCFIGQSGTGKTTLLSLLRQYFIALDETFLAIRNNQPKSEIESDFLFNDFNYNLKVKSLSKRGDIVLNGLEEGSSWKLVNWFTKNQIFDELDKQQKLCIYISDSAAAESNAFLRRLRIKKKQGNTYIETVEQLQENKRKESEELEIIHNKKNLQIGTNSNEIWEYILSDINEYDTNLNDIALSMVQEISNFSADRLVKRITDWKSENPNPRVELANKCLNPLLKNFFLEIDTDNTEVPIVLKTTKGFPLGSHLLSTGTKQLLSTAIPIFKLDTDSTVILFDEPERSLFPDVQRILIDYYVSLAPEAQFFFATHSPIIASAFEPCERFILYFDENGDVNFHRGVAPEGDDPNDILRQDFAMADLMLQKGLEAYAEYRQLAMQIRAETDEDKKNDLIAKRIELGNRYNF